MESDQSLLCTLKKASSISYVSSKLGVSRPTLYRYVDLYESGDKEKVPEAARDFFVFCRKVDLSEDDVSKYFLVNRNEDTTWGEESGRGACLTGGDRVMIIVRNPEKDRAVEVSTEISGETIVIGTYHLSDEKNFVTIDDLVPGHSFKYRLVGNDGKKSKWETFTVEFHVSSQGRRSRDGPRRTL